MSVSIEALAMAGADYTEWGMDIEELERMEMGPPAPHLYADDYEDHEADDHTQEEEEEDDDYEDMHEANDHPQEEEEEDDNYEDHEAIDHPQEEEELTKVKQTETSKEGLTMMAIVLIVIVIAGQEQYTVVNVQELDSCIGRLYDKMPFLKDVFED